MLIYLDLVLFACLFDVLLSRRFFFPCLFKGIMPLFEQITHEQLILMNFCKWKKLWTLFSKIVNFILSFIDIQSCAHLIINQLYQHYLLQAKFRRCDQRNLNYSPLCSLIPKFSPVHWQKPIKEIYESRKATPSYIRQSCPILINFHTFISLFLVIWRMLSASFIPLMRRERGR